MALSETTNDLHADKIPAANLHTNRQHTHSLTSHTAFKRRGVETRARDDKPSGMGLTDHSCVVLCWGGIGLATFLSDGGAAPSYQSSFKSSTQRTHTYRETHALYFE